MAVYEYSYTTLDPARGQVRTFSITTDSRSVALCEIRRAVQVANRKALDRGVTRLLTLPSARDIDAAPPRAGASMPGRTPGRVWLYA